LSKNAFLYLIVVRSPVECVILSAVGASLTTVITIDKNADIGISNMIL